MSGIGTLSERSLHAALKWYYEPLEEFHEVPVGKFIADIKRGNQITEIQTQSFDKLRRKLAVFLEEFEVTVVCPVAHVKYLEWINETTGETIRQRKSPKLGSCHEVLRELYHIRQFLTHPNLKLRIILLEVTEQRTENRKNRKGYSRTDTFPRAVSGEMVLDGVSDYAKLIPVTLDEEFTTTEFVKAAKISAKNAWFAVNVLNYLGVITLAGKSGRSNLYTARQKI